MERLKKEIYRHHKITIFVDSNKAPAFKKVSTYSHSLAPEGILLETSPPVSGNPPLNNGDLVPMNFLLSSSIGTISVIAKVL